MEYNLIINTADKSLGSYCAQWLSSMRFWILDTRPDPVIISSQGTTHCNYSKSKEHVSTIYSEKTFPIWCPVSSTNTSQE